MNGKEGERTASFWRSLANTEQPEELIDTCEKGGCGYVNPEVMLALGNTGGRKSIQDSIAILLCNHIE